MAMDKLPRDDNFDECEFDNTWQIPKPTFVPGQCGIHVNQWDSCLKEDSDYTCQIILKDGAGNVIGTSDEQPCNDKDPF